MSYCDFRAGERGEGRMGFLMTMLVLATIGYFALQGVPHYVRKVQMQESTTDIVRLACTRDVNASEIRSRLEEKAKELQLPPDAGIEVSRSGKTVKASISYSQEIKLPFYSYIWPVRIEVQDSGF